MAKIQPKENICTDPVQITISTTKTKTKKRTKKEPWRFSVKPEAFTNGSCLQKCIKNVCTREICRRKWNFVQFTHLSPTAQTKTGMNGQEIQLLFTEQLMHIKFTDTGENRNRGHPSQSYKILRFQLRPVRNLLWSVRTILKRLTVDQPHANAHEFFETNGLLL